MFKCVETDEIVEDPGNLKSEVCPESTGPYLTPSETEEVDSFFENDKDFGESIKDEKVYTNIQEMNEQIKSLISKSDVFLTGRHSGTRASKCNVCGKLRRRSVIRDHIEAHHINAFQQGCDLCGKNFETRNSLMTHKIIKHSG